MLREKYCATMYKHKVKTLTIEQQGESTVLKTDLI